MTIEIIRNSHASQLHYPLSPFSPIWDTVTWAQPYPAPQGNHYPDLKNKHFLTLVLWFPEPLVLYGSRLKLGHLHAYSWMRMACNFFHTGFVGFWYQVYTYNELGVFPLCLSFGRVCVRSMCSWKFSRIFS